MNKFLGWTFVFTYVGSFIIALHGKPTLFAMATVFWLGFALSRITYSEP